MCCGSVAMSEWRSIETAPSMTRILVYGGVWDGEISGPTPSFEAHVVIDRYGNKMWAVCGTDAYSAQILNPTHWMPLPSPPQLDDTPQSDNVTD